jgi:hypothetical protein
MKVKVLKFAGETGLRNPGAEYYLDKVLAEKLAKRGFIEIVEGFKQEKTKIKTKELKLKRETKKRK